MRIKLNFLAALMVAAITFTGINCSKEEEDNMERVPKITLIEIAPTEVTQFTDSIGIIIQYKDEDGDIGFLNPDSLALTIQDMRLSTPDYYYVSALTPDEQELNIQGTMRIVIRNTFLLGNGDLEKTTYKIRLKDRAGNWSNTLVTPEITITR